MKATDKLLNKIKRDLKGLHFLLGHGSCAPKVYSPSKHIISWTVVSQENEYVRSIDIEEAEDENIVRKTIKNFAALDFAGRVHPAYPILARSLDLFPAAPPDASILGLKVVYALAEEHPDEGSKLTVEMVENTVNKVVGALAANTARMVSELLMKNEAMEEETPDDEE